jgi:hypothetical protein
MMRDPPGSDRDAVWLVVGFTCAMASAGCSTRKEAAPAEVVVVVTTDMAVPADIDRIYLKITSSDDASGPLEQTYCLVGEDAGLPTAGVDAGATDDGVPDDAGACAADARDAGMKRAHLPATVALLQAAAIHIEGRLGSEVRVARDQQVTLPVGEGPTLLAMPLDYLCTVTAGGWTTCPDSTFTCQAGDCRSFPVSIAGSDLPAYAGLSAGACFDVVRCFDSANITIPTEVNDVGECQVSPSSPSDTTFSKPDINVALVVNRSLAGNDYGFCTSDSTECLIPLDLGTGPIPSPQRTWYPSTNGVGGTNIILPYAVCTDIGDGGDGKPLLGVAISADCLPKIAGTCAE